MAQAISRSFVLLLHATRAGKEKTMKNELNELLQEGYQAEKEFIATLSDQERNADGNFEHWTAKDTLAHNSYWRKHHAEDILAVLAGDSPIHIDDDQLNEGVYSQYKDQSWKEVETLAKTSLERMGAALAALSEGDLQRSDFYPWEQGRPLWREIVGNIYTHPILHLSDWHIKRDNATRAAEMYQEMTGQLTSLDDSPDWRGTIRYNNACSFSLLGDKEKAISELREALKLRPDLTEWSQQDPDFEPIRGEAGYKAIYE
jgi:tetratricopeptide (TPR) repeat protein